METQQLKSAVALLSVVSTATLVTLKIIIGLLIGSVSVISEAIHSGVDLVASIIALVAVRTGAKPADTRHPFGHGKIENISAAIEAILIFIAAAWIIYEAILELVHPREVESPGWGVAVMAGSAAVNVVVSSLLFKVGRKTDSVALQADAWHLRTDVYTSVGVMGGLGIICLGERFFPNVDLHFVDPLAAIVVALLIVSAAWTLTRRSVVDLLDVKLPVQEEERLCAILAGFEPRVRGFHQMRTRKAGPARFVEFHIFVDSHMTVLESHELSHAVAACIRENFPGTTVTIHVEPCRGDCFDKRCTGCLLDEEQRQAIRETNFAPPTPPT